jgi:hypothetical protein
VPVSTEDRSIVACADDDSRSSATTTEPSNVLKVPRTLLIRCRTVKATSVCVGSMVQVPAVTAGTVGTSVMRSS